MSEAKVNEPGSFSHPAAVPVFGVEEYGPKVNSSIPGFCRFS